MVQYLLRRLVTLLITLVGIMVVTFFISLVVPVDPLASIAGPQAPPETVERLRTPLLSAAAAGRPGNLISNRATGAG